jgi:polysaccharide export outer membrane protein
MHLHRGLATSLTILGLALAAGGCSGGSSIASLPAASSDSYVLDTGDKLNIRIYGLDGFGSSPFMVDKDGMLSLPMLNKVRAAGMTTEQLEAHLHQVLLERQILNNPFVDIELATLRPFYIMGEVNKPGEYEYRPGMSVLTAVTIAGGFTYRAEEDSVVISRKVDGKDVTGKADVDEPVQPGDQIRVIEGWF